MVGLYCPFLSLPTESGVVGTYHVGNFYFAEEAGVMNREGVQCGGRENASTYKRPFENFSVQERTRNVEMCLPMEREKIQVFLRWMTGDRSMF